MILSMKRSQPINNKPSNNKPSNNKPNPAQPINMKQIYYNQKQIDYLASEQKRACLIWGRGTGKSTSISGRTNQMARRLPRGKIFFSASTYNQILTKMMPAVESKWQEFGLIDGVHYVVGKSPPKFFDKPFSPPRKYDNIISFFNGFAVEFLSMDRPDLSRGGSYDGGIIDEAALLKEDMIDKVLLPSIRGNRHKFSDPLHGHVSFITSMPWQSSGNWLFKYEDLARADPEKYFYSEATIYDNIEVIGAEGIKMLKDKLPYLTFAVECENKRLTKGPDTFYHKFSDNRHTYEPVFLYSNGPRGIQVDGTAELKGHEVIDMSLDFSGWFNCYTLWNASGGFDRCFDLAYVKDDQKLEALMKIFTDKYEGHDNKIIRLWGEPRGHDKNPTGDTIYNQLATLLKAAGWSVQICAHAGRTTHHIDRWRFINSVLSEGDITHATKVRISKETCKDLIIALNICKVTKDFKKDKSNEKDRAFPQEHAPHLTDTLDYYLVQKYEINIDSWEFPMLGGGDVSFL